MGFISCFRKIFGKQERQYKPTPIVAPKPEPKSYIAQSHYLVTDNIPFTPSDRQIIYIEDRYDIEVNNFIKSNESAIRSHFESLGYEFCYIPSLVERLSDRSIVEYYAPYAKELTQLSLDSSFVINSMIARYQEAIKPSLLYYCPQPNSDNLENSPRFKYVNIDLSQLSEDFSELLNYIIEDTRRSARDSGTRFSVMDSCSDVIDIDDINQSAIVPTLPTIDRACQDAHKSKYKADAYCPNDDISAKRSLGRKLRLHLDKLTDALTEDWDDETDELVSNLNDIVERLSQKGISEAILMQLVSRPEIVSRLVITRDYRILLPEYNNMEISMTPIVKAVYLLFLHHPEGIIFKQLGDYRLELQHIYECIKGEPATEKMLQSINLATDPFSNSINEKVARIREAFVTRFDERLATNYIVNGERGEAKLIPLNREFVEWQ